MEPQIGHLKTHRFAVVVNLGVPQSPSRTRSIVHQALADAFGMRRKYVEISDLPPPVLPRRCERCESELDTSGFCVDETCPFSDHKQGCPAGWTGHPNCPFGQRDALEEDCTCGRRIRAHAYTDDHVEEAQFTANLWFEQAIDGEILELAACGFGGDYPSDDVARFFGPDDPQVRRIFAHLVQRPLMPGTQEPVGLKCRVDSADALRWIKVHRPHLYARVGGKEIE